MSDCTNNCTGSNTINSTNSCTVNRANSCERRCQNPCNAGCANGCGGSENWSNWNNWNNWNWQHCPCFPCFPCFPWRHIGQCGDACTRWAQPIFASPAQLSDAGVQNGATLVIHKIVLEPCGNTTCTPRTFHIRITGPSYPRGEVFRLRAGSCIELDEPLVLTGLEPGTYCIEELHDCPNAYISTFTGPVCGRRVNVTRSWFPTVITICSRKRLCRLCHGFGCGCGACNTCR